MCLLEVGWPLSGLDPSQHFEILHIMRSATVLASTSRHLIVVRRGSMPDDGRRLTTSYVSCPVLRALPEVNKVDGQLRALSVKPWTVTTETSTPYQTHATPTF